MFGHEDVGPEVVEPFLSAFLKGSRQPIAASIPGQEGPALETGEGQAMGLAIDIETVALLAMDLGHGSEYIQEDMPM